MSPIAATALSGLQASTLRMGVSAHNLANGLTPGFHRQAVVAQAAAEGGVTAAVQRLPEAGADLAADLVAQRMAAYSFEANLRVLQTHDRTLGALLDVLA